MRRPLTPRLITLAFLWVGGGLLLSASECTTPEATPEPGQPLTWAEQHQLNLQQAEINHDHGKQEKCRPGNNCMSF